MHFFKILLFIIIDILFRIVNKPKIRCSSSKCVVRWFVNGFIDGTKMALNLLFDSIVEAQTPVQVPG
jgi:hypothetical protein